MRVGSVVLLLAFTLLMTVAVHQLLLFSVPNMPAEIRAFVAGMFTFAGILLGLAHKL